ncbi:hypothetical protein [Nocardiopsis kunsanensis]|uniref:Uncharacterized protein n=1 Tax=Nocardiopsis kunsanensis TaxID=141693 RepID=A0A918X929_9ACTN|nr:hypothetical protein [Nocardiopsis kunsanensis]GHD18879.1 hypothetical protein GCM10007147_09510 [Nocardiopsis kunsanensis]
MPSKRRRFSAFVKILFSVTLVCGLLVAAGYYVLTTVDPLEKEEVEPGCRLDLPEGSYDMRVSQAANASTVGGVAFSRDLPPEAVTVAYATVWQESTFHNVEHGDRDSVGLFQQRPSQEWGDTEEILDPVFSSRGFYDTLAEVGGWQDMPVHEAAQQVQRSADGWAYDQHEQLSEEMAVVLTGTEGPTATCWYDEQRLTDLQETGADLEGAHEELERVFGTDPADLPVDNSPATGDLGWAMALWSVTHAEEYGLTSVVHDGYRWTATDGSDEAEAWQEAAEDNGGQIVLN